MEKLAYELHKPARKNFKRRNVILHGLGDLLQIDLVDMSKLSRSNKGYKFILTGIDCFSKYGYAIPLKNKSGPVVTEAMKDILKHTIYKNVQSDLGKEFYNKEFQTLMKKHNINHYSTFSNLKASICERFNRTLKTNMYRQFTIQNNYNWLDILDDLVDNYNRTKHSTIGMKPIDVGIKDESKLLKMYRQQSKYKEKRRPLKIGQVVRIANTKNIFTKSYLENWSEDLYRIRRVQNTKPVTYLLSDNSTNEPISGSFYREQIQPTSLTDYFRIDKVVRNRINKSTGEKEYLVTYKNSDKQAWLKESDLIQL
jgi:hypothetical protein